MPTHKWPLIGRLYGNTRGPSGHSERFYENIQIANSVENELTGRLKDGKPIDDYIKENPNAIEMMGRGNMEETHIRNLRKLRRDIVRQGLPDAAKRKQAINEEIGAVMKGFNDEMKRLRH